MAVCGISTGLTGRILMPSLMTQSRYGRRPRSDTHTCRSLPTCSSSSFCTRSCTCRGRGIVTINMSPWLFINKNEEQLGHVTSPPGGAAGRPGSTAAWWTSSPLRLQRPPPLSSGRGRLSSSHPPTQTTSDPARCPSCPWARHRGGHGGRRHSAMPGTQKRYWLYEELYIVQTFRFWMCIITYLCLQRNKHLRLYLVLLQFVWQQSVSDDDTLLQFAETLVRKHLRVNINHRRQFKSLDINTEDVLSRGFRMMFRVVVPSSRGKCPPGLLWWSSARCRRCNASPPAARHHRGDRWRWTPACTRRWWQPGSPRETGRSHAHQRTAARHTDRPPRTELKRERLYFTLVNLIHISSWSVKCFTSYYYYFFTLFLLICSVLHFQL